MAATISARQPADPYEAKEMLRSGSEAQAAVAPGSSLAPQRNGRTNHVMYEGQFGVPGRVSPTHQY